VHFQTFAENKLFWKSQYFQKKSR